VLVALPQPFDFWLSTERFRAFGPDPANLWEDGRLFRVFDGREVEIAEAPGGVRIDPGDARLAAHVRRCLGADFDLDGFARFAATGDPVLARVVERLRGLRPPLAPDPFEALVTSITAQQVSLRAAFAIRGRLIRTFGKAALRAYAFPKRDDLAPASASDLTELGFSRRKADYVLSLARADIDLDALAALPDDQVKARLVELPGIGEWTADWFLARHLARPDAWPAGDLGLRKAVSALYLDGRDASTDEVRIFGERFSPHRNLAAHYLLTALRLPER
jgi:3-methyladenine DNA glycosylase/8-oxoguanine DNA glycosylase